MRLWRGDYEVVIRKHALLRAVERDIPQDLVEKTLRYGKFERYAKHGLRIWKDFHEGRIACVGQTEGGRIVIFTITINRW